MTPDYIDPAIGSAIAVILWMILLILAFRSDVRQWFSDFFANRRHKRRERNRMRAYAAMDAQLTTRIYTPNQIRESEGLPAEPTKTHGRRAATR